MEITGFEVFDDFNDQTMCEDIKNKLLEKYNKQFEVLRIGNRFGGTSIDRIDTYCSPQENPNIIFTVTQDLSMEGKEIETDDYYIKNITSVVDTLLVEELKKVGVDSICRTETIKKNSLDKQLNIQDFINKYPNMNFLSILVVTEVEKYKLYEIFEILNSTYDNIKLNSIVYTVTNETMQELKEKIYGTPFIPRALVEDMGFKYKSFIKIENGLVTEIVGE